MRRTGGCSTPTIGEGRSREPKKDLSIISGKKASIDGSRGRGTWD